MTPINVIGIAFVSLFGGALLGSFIGARLPKHHMTSENKDVVRLGMGLVGTIAGIALGLMMPTPPTNPSVVPLALCWKEVGPKRKKRF